MTRWFELHAINDMVGQENKGWSLAYYEWLKKQTFPIYMQEKNDLIPQAIVFPYKMLCERFGPNPKKGLTNWFTSSIAWMMAYAITMMKEGDELAIFGVDMAALEEAYTAQKAGLHRFVEYANAAGIKVTIPLESCLGQSLPLYGYAEATIIGRKLQWRLHEMTTIRGNLITECRQKELQAAFFEGAIEGCKYDLRTWPSGLEAELDTNGKEYGDAFVSELKSKSEQFGKQAPTPLTGDFVENGQGVFVPQGLGAAPPAGLPQGSTITVRADGKRTTACWLKPVRMGAHLPEQIPEPRARRKRNGIGAEAGE